MAKTQLKLKATLIGRLATPMIVAKPFIKKAGCWIRIMRDLNTEKYPILTPIGKLVKGERKTPTVLRGYRGFVKVSCVGYNKEKLLSKLNKFLNNNFLGTKTTEGFGRIKWLECNITNFERIKKSNSNKKKFKIRKGLGQKYPAKLKQLLIALMLHDFIKTEKHHSKIYQEVEIINEEIRKACKNHHNTRIENNDIQPIIKYYDGLASYITRKKPLKTNSRYDKENGKINFEKLAKEIEERQHSVHRLYDYIFKSEELKRIVEAMSYGKNNLRNHLLLMVNLAINGYYNKTLKIKKGKLSLSVSKREELLTTKDAERHSFLDPEQC